MNTTELIDKLVIIADLAKDKADQSGDFQQIEKIEEWGRRNNGGFTNAVLIYNLKQIG